MYGIDFASWRRGIYRDADKGAGSGGSGGTPPANKPGGNPPTADGTGADKPNTGDGGQPGSITLTEAQLQERIEAALKERLEREKRKSEKDAQKAKEDAEAESLAKSQEWQKLSEKQAGTIKTLETEAAKVESLSQERDRYKASLEALLKTQREGLPAHILTLLDKLDPAAQLEYIATNAAVLKPQGGQSTDKPGGPPASPNPGDKRAMTTEEQEKARARQGAWTLSNF